jgi:hypothetical protein
MSRNNFTFATPKAQAVMQSILDLLGKGAATTLELAAAINKARCTTVFYLAQLRNEGKVVCLVESTVRPKNGSAPGVWALNVPGAPTDHVPPVVEEEIADDDDDELDRFPRRVVVRKQWEPLHMRMPMECLLFGVPPALQGRLPC